MTLSSEVGFVFKNSFLSEKVGDNKRRVLDCAGETELIKMQLVAKESSNCD